MNIILLGPPGSGKGTQSNNLVEKYKLSHTEIGMQWNFILDNFSPWPSAGAYMLHHVKKEFNLSFNDL